jgi:hypothetical protein
VGQGGLTADQQSAPDERTDVAQDDAELIDHRRWLSRLHGQSVRRSPLHCKDAPRY